MPAAFVHSNMNLCLYSSVYNTNKNDRSHPELDYSRKREPNDTSS